MHKPETKPTNSESLFKIRRKLLLLVAAAAILAASGITADLLTRHGASSTPNTQTQQLSKNQQSKFLDQLGQSLIDRHEDSHGGWRFKSAIQAPHYQTDRDVGAAGVGMGFLAMSEAEPQDSRWTNGAKQTVAWLMAVSKEDGQGGLYWPDYVDDQETSGDVYTSFDDGTIGIGDYFWQLYEKTNDPQYKKVAIESVQWTLNQAEPIGNGYRWKWNVTDPQSPYYMGMGEGAAGITYALAEFSQRIQPTDPALAAKCNTYVEGSLNYINSVRQNLANNGGTNRTVPETGVVGKDGDTTMDSGYLSGGAGDAFLYLKLYKLLGDKKYLDEATTILGWLSDSQTGPMVKTGGNSVSWKLALDPQSGNDDHYATGVEEGAAGIGWTYLQAYKVTGNKEYLKTAESAANWLIAVAIKNPDGSFSWHEDEHPTNPLVHANLNNGAAGIGMYFQDMYIATGKTVYKTYADGAYLWLKKSAISSGKDIYWKDNGGLDDNGKSDPYADDSSWHWGKAGIIEFVQRLEGGPQDIIGEQPGFDKQ